MIKDPVSLEFLFWGSLASLLLSYGAEFLFLIIGLISILRQKMQTRSSPLPDSEYPSISIIVPCYNEEKTIHRTISFLKKIDYPNFNTIFVNDGSSDHTLQTISAELPLITFLSHSEKGLPTRPVRSIYTTRDGSFFVVDKENGGKADALNAGINVSQADLICCVDADTIIKTDGLKRMAARFHRDPRVVAAGGNVRVKNGSERDPRFPHRIRAPRRMITRLQAMEYIRSINISRNALASFNANLIISGAFGLFKTGVIREIGGYEKFSRGEDIELLTRIHLHLKESKTPYRVVQSYFSDAFTDAPETRRELKSQRKRWQLGLVSTLRGHLIDFLRHPLSPITFFTLPYLVAFEILLPLVQLVSYLAIPVLLILKVIPPAYLWALLLVLGLSILVNILFLVLDFSFHSYYRFRDQLRIIFSSLVEPLYYHQLNCYWKLLGLVASFRNIFVRSAWVPPRGNKDYRSMIGGDPASGELSRARNLRVIPDYRSFSGERIIILYLEGAFDPGDAGRFEELIQYFQTKNRHRFILDLTGLKDLSSEALSILLTTGTRLRNRGGGVVLVNTPRKIHRILKISNAVKEIKCCPDYLSATRKIKYE